MTTLYEAAKQALAFTMRDFSTVRDFEAAKAVLQDTIRSALVEEEKAVAWLAERKEHWRKEKEKIQATDPELSAALGWPGGISDPVLDRTRLLQMVAALRLASKQALEALYQAREFTELYDTEHAAAVNEWRHENIAALRAALAQQDEPVQEPYTGDVTRIMRDAGMTFHLGLPHKAVIEQMTRVVDLVYAEASIKAAQQFAVALAQQAEPVEPVAWEASEDGRTIQDNDFTHDVVLRVMGDFENDEQRVRYAKRIVDKLNAALAQQDSACLHGVEDGACKECYATETDLSRCPQCNGPADNGFDRSFPPSPYLCTKCMAEPVEPVAYFGSAYVNENGVHITTVLGPVAIPQDAKLYTAPPQRTMVLLTEEEIDAEWHELDGRASALFKRVIRKFARAVEKASWKKNHGQA